MTLAKVHSEASLAAYIYHGWEIASVHSDPATGTVSEHVLTWPLPEYPRSPSVTEISQFIHLSDVEDIFVIEGRGVVIVPGLPRAKEGLARKETPIVLMDYRESAFVTIVRDLEFSSPPSLNGRAILLMPDVSSSDVKVGMQVWARLPQ